MRPNRTRRGQWAEILAVVWLWLHGWRVMARHWSGPHHSGAGEVDIVARRAHILIFVEVKFRKTPDAATHAMTPQQWRRQQRTVRAFLATYPHLAEQCSWRLDLILLSPWRWPRHIAEAWPLDGISSG